MKKAPLFLVLIALVTMTIPVAASPPQEVGFRAYITNFNPFEATIIVTEQADILCSSGFLTQLSGNISGTQSGGQVNVHFRRIFTCDNGIDSFILNINGHIVHDPYDPVVHWNVLEGTGAYTNLKGSGTLITIDFDPINGTATDIFTGWMHIE